MLLARIVRPQGRRGEVLAEIFTDFPERFEQRKQIFLRSPDASAMRETRVEAHWLHKERIVLKFFQVDSIAEAETLRGFEVVVPREERMPLEGDAVYISDLLGMHVIDTSREEAVDTGEIIAVEPEGAGPAMLVIRANGEELLIPFVRAYLRKIDLAGGRLEMELPAGLLSMQRSD